MSDQPQVGRDLTLPVVIYLLYMVVYFLMNVHNRLIRALTWLAGVAVTSSNVCSMYCTKQMCACYWQVLLTSLLSLLFKFPDKTEAGYESQFQVCVGNCSVHQAYV